MGGHVFAEGEESGSVVDCGGERFVGWHCNWEEGEMMVMRMVEMEVGRDRRFEMREVEVRGDGVLGDLEMWSDLSGGN